jgi:hypothetical protein
VSCPFFLSSMLFLLKAGLYVEVGTEEPFCNLQIEGQFFSYFLSKGCDMIWMNVL